MIIHCVVWEVLEMILHRWDLPPAEARRLQEKLRADLILAWDDRPIKLIICGN